MTDALEISYRSSYRYDEPVRESQAELRACPANDPHQRVDRYRAEVTPTARTLWYVDYWGTRVDTFGIRDPHDEMTIQVTALVEISREPQTLPAVPSEAFAAASFVEAHADFLGRSPHVDWNDDVERFSRSVAGECDDDLAATCAALRSAVTDGFEYAPGETYVGVSVNEVFATKRGVCQDFAHVLIACCRSIGVPARYVSGYLDAGAGTSSSEDVQMALQTHAWVEVALPEHGWHALDPTTGRPVAGHHVAIGRARDYDDVAPFRGVYSGVSENRVDVDVRMRRQAQSLQRAMQQQ